MDVIPYLAVCFFIIDESDVVFFIYWVCIFGVYHALLIFQLIEFQHDSCLVRVQLVCEVKLYMYILSICKLDLYTECFLKYIH